MDNSDRNRLTVDTEEYEYVMPLAGSSPKVSIDMGGADFGSPTFGGSRPRNRRGSNLTDATPRFQNYTRSDDFHEQQKSSPIPVYKVPALPVYDQSDGPTSAGSVHSPNPMSESAGDVASFDEDTEGNSISQSSYNTPSITSNGASYTMSTPVGNRQSMYEMRREPSAMQITFDGQITQVPIRDHPEQPPAPNSISTSSHNTGSRKSKRKSFETGISGSNHSQSIDLDDDYMDGASDNTESTLDPLICCGIVMPVCVARAMQKPPSLSRISLFIVTVAPCFWCCGRSLQGSSTDRAVLTRLNILALFFAFVQLFAGCGLATLLLILDDEPGAFVGFGPHLWNINGATFSAGMLGFATIVTCSCTIRVIKEVDLVGAIRHYWVLLWLLPFQSFFSVSLFDYFWVTHVWIKHWWTENQLSWFRSYFCAPGTANTLCTVPQAGGPDYPSETAWCLDNYQSDQCTTIRDDAQSRMEFSMLIFYTSLGGWSVLLLCLLSLMLRSLEKIISKPIVQKSRETNVPAWLTLPTAGNALVGSILLYSPTSLLSSSSGVDNSWIGVVYLAAAGLFLVALLLGWFLSTFSIRSSLDKKNKSVAVVIFIGVMASNAVMLATIFVASIMFSGNLVQSPIAGSERGEVACFVDTAGTCTNCDDPIPRNRCPEWTLDDVTRILQTQLKQSATLAAIFIVYAISVLRFGFVLRKHLSMYQIDYV